MKKEKIGSDYNRRETRCRQREKNVMKVGGGEEEGRGVRVEK